MTKKILLALALGLTAASSRADISDSGNLTIGGNGVFQGTTTVQGNSFSVGGATFTVAGGSVTLGGRLNVSAAGIKWADGTVSVSSAAGGGSGNAVLSATQTWSGANIFASSVTVGPTTYGVALDFSKTLKGGWSIVASTAVTALTGTTGATFTNWDSSYTCRIHWSMSQTSAAGIYKLQFDDTGNNYYFADRLDTITGGTQIDGSAGGAYIGLSGVTSVGTSNGGSFGGYVEIVRSPNSNVNATVYGQSFCVNQTLTNVAARWDIGGAYIGSTNITTVKFFASAGAMTGTIYVECLVPHTHP